MEILHTAAVFAIALMSGMGIGSAGLMVIWLTAVPGMPQIEAQGINLVFFLLSASASMAVHLPRRRLPLFPILLLALTGTAAAYFGARTAMLLPQELVRKLFGGMLIAAGGASLWRPEKKSRKKSVKRM